MKIFLDNLEFPSYVINKMTQRMGNNANIYFDDDWKVCRNFHDFINVFRSGVFPEIVSIGSLHGANIKNYNLDNLHRLFMSNARQRNYAYDCLRFLILTAFEWEEKLPKIYFHSSFLKEIEYLKIFLNVAKNEERRRFAEIEKRNRERVR